MGGLVPLAHDKLRPWEWGAGRSVHADDNILMTNSEYGTAICSHKCPYGWRPLMSHVVLISSRSIAKRISAVTLNPVTSVRWLANSTLYV